MFDASQARVSDSSSARNCCTESSGGPALWPAVARAGSSVSPPPRTLSSPPALSPTPAAPCLSSARGGEKRGGPPVRNQDDSGDVFSWGWRAIRGVSILFFFTTRRPLFFIAYPPRCPPERIAIYKYGKPHLPTQVIFVRSR
jgi:hypothetical protein